MLPTLKKLNSTFMVKYISLPKVKFFWGWQPVWSLKCMCYLLWWLLLLSWAAAKMRDQPRTDPTEERMSPCLALLYLVATWDATVPIRAPTLARDPIQDSSSIFRSSGLVNLRACVSYLTFEVALYLIEGRAVAGHEWIMPAFRNPRLAR